MFFSLSRIEFLDMVNVLIHEDEGVILEKHSDLKAKKNFRFRAIRIKHYKRFFFGESSISMSHFYLQDILVT